MGDGHFADRGLDFGQRTTMRRCSDDDHHVGEARVCLGIVMFALIFQGDFA